MSNHQRLEAWKRSHELVVAVYRATATWPTDERYGLTAQSRRAAVSIPVNIAEGAARRGPREWARFLDISLGSLAELDCLLLLARDLNILPALAWRDLENLRSEAGRLTWGLYRSLDRSRR